MCYPFCLTGKNWWRHHKPSLQKCWHHTPPSFMFMCLCFLDFQCNSWCLVPSLMCLVTWYNRVKKYSFLWQALLLVLCACYAVYLLGMATGRIGADIGISVPDTRKSPRTRIRPNKRTGWGRLSHNRTKWVSGIPWTERLTASQIPKPKNPSKKSPKNYKEGSIDLDLQGRERGR